MSMSNYYMHKKTGYDWWTILIYLALVVCGWFCIYSSSYSGEGVAFYDIDHRSGMQLLWIAGGLVLAIVILFTDSRQFFNYALVIYVIGLFLMLLVIFVGREINGAHSWLFIGPISFQPVEFMKIGTALLFARLIDMNGFIENTGRNFLVYSAVLMIPVVLTLLQNDTGSAMVFFIFFVVLYREGLAAGIFATVFSVVAVTVLTFLIDREVLILLLVVFFIIFFAFSCGEWKLLLRCVASSMFLLCLLSLLLYYTGVSSFFGISLTIVIIVLLMMLLVYSHIRNIRMPWIMVIIFLSLVSLCFVVDTAFDLLKPHQQERILDIFGISTDPHGISYNVNQSKIAIGSGGLTGKGFLKGTQTRYSYVPEQETDFIFCTIGEEQGFVGSSMIVVLFMLLVIRLMLMGERAPNPFSRIYCYCTAGVFFFHFVINVSMTIGLFPVVGIPLPFFSYGGSSFICFTILLFIAIRLDQNRLLDNF